MRTQGEVICDDSGTPQRMVGICEDVTAERRAAERADARALAGRLLEVSEQIGQAGTLVEGGESARALAEIESIRRTVTRMADAVLGSPGAASGTRRRFGRGAGVEST